MTNNNTTDIGLLWNTLLPSLEKSLNKPIFEALISSTKPIRFNEKVLEIAVPNELVKEWLSKHCITLLEQELRQLGYDINRVGFIVGSPEMFNTPLLEKGVGSGLPTAHSASSALYLNARYTFDTFVVGHGNRFAHAAALAVAEAPAKAYNPLFLYGGVGLGKTHLMQAIAHHVLRSNARAKVLYITSENFTNELINSIRDDKTLAFRNKYRNIDLLMVDDVQFIAGKERTQEEFFHTFNALYEASKQIVVSSDRPPKEIPTLEERLRSRFEWGLTADIQAPDFETRIAILKKKAELSEVNVSDEILSYIASKVMSNIRELEGALIRVVAYASLTNAEINAALVDHVLGDLLDQRLDGRNLSLDLIKKLTAEYYSLRTDDLSAKDRTKEVALARQVAMYLSRDLTGTSLPKIGAGFGGRDHTTVLHAVKKIKAALKTDSTLQTAVKTISAKLKSYAS